MGTKRNETENHLEGRTNFGLTLTVKFPYDGVQEGVLGGHMAPPHRHAAAVAPPSSNTSGCPFHDQWKKTRLMRATWPKSHQQLQMKSSVSRLGGPEPGGVLHLTLRGAHQSAAGGEDDEPCWSARFLSSSVGVTRRRGMETAAAWRRHGAGARAAL